MVKILRNPFRSALTITSPTDSFSLASVFNGEWEDADEAEGFSAEEKDDEFMLPLPIDSVRFTTG